MSAKISPVSGRKLIASTLTGKPSCSKLWSMPELSEASYEIMRETSECSFYLIQSAQGLAYVLYSRKLPSHITEMNMIHRTFMEEIEILKLYNQEDLFVPKLINVVISEDSSFWNGTIFFVDILFLLPEPEKEYQTLESYMKENTIASQYDFQILSDIAALQQTFLNLNLSVGHMIVENFIVQKNKESNDSRFELVEKEEEEKLDLNLKDRKLTRYKPSLLCLSVGIIDREIEKSDYDESQLLLDNKANLMSIICQMASGSEESCSLYESLNNLDSLFKNVESNDRDRYREDMKSLLTDLAYTKTAQENYNDIQNLLVNHMQVECKEFELPISSFNENIFGKDKTNRSTILKPHKQKSCFVLNNKVLIISLLAIIVLGFLFYPLLSILKKSDEKEISEEDTNKLLDMNEKILGVMSVSSNSTNTQNLEQIIKELNQNIIQLIDNYNSALLEHNVTATLIKELEEKLSLLEEKEREYAQNRSEWENIFANNTARIEALKIIIKNTEGFYNYTVAQITNLTAIQGELNKTLLEKQTLIQNVIVPFFSSLMDVADLSRLNETFFRMYHLESLTDFALCSDGGFILVGSIYVENSTNKLTGIILRIASNGKEIWRNVLMMDGSVKIWSVAIGENEQIAIAGCLPRGYSLSKTLNGALFLGSLDKEGHYLWSYTEEYTFDGAHMVIASSDGNFVAVGQLMKQLYKKHQMTIRKFTPSGSKVWQYNTELNGVDRWVSTYYSGDYSCYDATSIIETRDGNYLIGGYKNDYQWLLKLSTDGNSIFETTADFFWYYIQEIKELEDGYIIAVLNRFNGFWFGTYSQIMMFSPHGELQWNVKSNSTLYSSIIYTTIDVLPDGFLIGGQKYFYDQYSIKRYVNYLCKYDFSRSLIWERTYSSGKITRVKYSNNSIMATTSSPGKSSFLKFYPS